MSTIRFVRIATIGRAGQAAWLGLFAFIVLCFAAAGIGITSTWKK
jgi:hypothetical protein